MLKYLFLCALSGASWAMPPGHGQSQIGPLSDSQWLDQCNQARVLYLGEEHNGPLDHQLQHDILEQLGRPPVVVAEMFQNVSRPALDAYVAGRLDDDQLRNCSEWEKRWGHPWEQYLPIWQLCQQGHWPLRPLRNSSESGKNLGKLGFEAFSPEERQGLAPQPYEFGPHPESLRPVFEGHAGKIGDEAFARFLKVQVLWEEYMAAQIRRALSETEGPVVVLVGKGHLTHGYGLPHRVQAQWPHPLTQKIVIYNPGEAERSRADLWWDPNQ
ncbi:ChaN family lipoprotein [bacterium]|nr:ChaN family lipoprotein [bacterium]